MRRIDRPRLATLVLAIVIVVGSLTGPGTEGRPGSPRLVADRSGHSLATRPETTEGRRWA